MTTVSAMLTGKAAAQTGNAMTKQAEKYAIEGSSITLGLASVRRMDRIIWRFAMSVIAIAFPTGGAHAQLGTFAYAETGGLCCVQAPASRDGHPNAPSPLQSSASVAYADTSSNGIPNPVTGAASAYSNLASGKLGIFYTASDYGYATASARVAERVNFTIANATASTVTPIEFNWVFHGTLEKRYGTASTQFIFGVNQTLANGSYGGTGGLGITRTSSLFTGYADTLSNSGWLSYDATPSADGDTYSVRALFGLKGANTTVDISASMNGSGRMDHFADFSQTASLMMKIPDIVTYNSASGVFLSQAGAVPEPLSWVMMIAGFGAVGATLRRSVQVPLLSA